MSWPYRNELDHTAELLGLGREFDRLAAADRERVLAAKVGLDSALALKRIAAALWGEEGTTGIIQLLNDMARQSA